MIKRLLAICLVLTGCGGQPPKPLPEPLQSAKQSEYRGMLAYQQGNYRGAIRYYSAALSRYRAVDDAERQAHAHINLIQSALLINAGTIVQTHLHGLQQLIQYRGLNALQSRYRLLYSDYLLDNEQYSEALAILDTMPPPANDDELQQAVAVNRAVAAVRLGQPDAAERLLQADRLAGRDSLAAARLQRLRADLAGSRKNFADAELSYNAALAYYRQALFQPGIAATLTELGKLNQQQQHMDLARDQLNRALAVRIYLTDFHSADLLLLQLAGLETSQGNHEAAQQYEQQRQRLKNTASGR